MSYVGNIVTKIMKILNRKFVTLTNEYCIKLHTTTNYNNVNNVKN